MTIYVHFNHSTSSKLFCLPSFKKIPHNNMHNSITQTHNLWISHAHHVKVSFNADTQRPARNPGNAQSNPDVSSTTISSPPTEIVNRFGADDDLDSMAAVPSIVVCVLYYWIHIFFSQMHRLRYINPFYLCRHQLYASFRLHRKHSGRCKLQRCRHQQLQGQFQDEPPPKLS